VCTLSSATVAEDPVVANEKPIPRNAVGVVGDLSRDLW